MFVDIETLIIPLVCLLYLLICCLARSRLDILSFIRYFFVPIQNISMYFSQPIDAMSKGNVRLSSSESIESNLS